MIVLLRSWQRRSEAMGCFFESFMEYDDSEGNLFPEGGHDSAALAGMAVGVWKESNFRSC